MDGWSQSELWMLSSRSDTRTPEGKRRKDVEKFRDVKVNSAATLPAVGVCGCNPTKTFEGRSPPSHRQTAYLTRSREDLLRWLTAEF